MKRARVLLWVVGAVMCVVSILLFTPLINVFDRADEPKPTTQSLAPTSPPTQEAARLAPAEIAPQRPEAPASSPAQEAARAAPAEVAPQQPETPAASSIQEGARLAQAEIAPYQPDQLDELHLDPPAQNSRHALAPDTEPPAAEASPATKTESPATANAVEVPSPVAVPSPTASKDEFVTITSAVSVRNGPSASAEVIGRAHAGARARVASHDSGWAQIVDPASGNTGWIDSSVLVPSATTATGEATDGAMDTSLDDQSGTSKRVHSATKSKHAAKAKHHRANHHYYGRPRFAFRFFFRSFRR
jgi:SH3-like domain-containing protein